MFRRTSPLEKKLIILAAISASVTFLAYIPSFWSGFVNWDDNLYVYENPDIRVFGISFLSRVFTSYVAYNWHPLTIISYALDFLFMGLNPFIYHLTNVVFHSLNTFLIAILTCRLFERAVPSRAEADSKLYGSTPALVASFVTALLFGLHPLHVESVAWVSERKDVLYSFFFLLSTLSYLKYVSARRYLNYAWALLFFVLSLMSKPMAVTLPVVLLMLDYYPLNRFENFKSARDSIWRVLLEKVPFLTFSALSAVLTIRAQKSGIISIATAGFVTRIFVAVRAYVFYLNKMIMPVKLAPFYPYPEKIIFLSHEFIWPVIVFLAISTFVLMASGRHKIFASAWLYYLITLLPVIGIVQVGSQAAADRYTYLPSLGPFMLAGIGVGRIFEKMGMERSGVFKDASAIKKTHALIVVAVTAISLFFLSFSTIKQEAIWKNSMTLWNYEIKEFPRAYGAYHNRAFVYMDIHNYKKALEDLDKALTINPGFTLSYYTRGLVHQINGDYLLTIKDFKAALALDPKNLKLHNDLGVSYGKLAQYDMAIQEFNKAIELDPKFGEAYNNRGYTYLGMGEYDKAIIDIKKALELNPNNAGACYNLGSAYSKVGDAKQAESYFKKAALLNGKPVK